MTIYPEGIHDFDEAKQAVLNDTKGMKLLLTVDKNGLIRIAADLTIEETQRALLVVVNDLGETIKKRAEQHSWRFN